jgi:hypothetical protein
MKKIITGNLPETYRKLTGNLETKKILKYRKKQG